MIWVGFIFFFQGGGISCEVGMDAVVVLFSLIFVFYVRFFLCMLSSLYICCIIS